MSIPKDVTYYLEHMDPPLYQLAPEGKLYICSGCGKRALTRCGWDVKGERTAIDHGWDESCMLSAVLVTKEEAEKVRAAFFVEVVP